MPRGQWREQARTDWQAATPSAVSMASIRSMALVSRESLTKREAQISAAGPMKASPPAYTGQAPSHTPQAMQLFGVLQVFEHVHLAFGGGGEHAVRLKIRGELPDLVEHRVDVGDEVALRWEAGQGRQFDDSQRTVCG